MSKSKKLSLPSSDTGEIFNYKPKDLVWSKMKGYPPWPAMICEPTIDLLNQTRKTSSKCCYFFGTRNFAWIEVNNLKPFEGPWKDDLTKGNKQTSSFKQALNDINAYLEDPTEVDSDVKAKTAMNHVTEADFDKLRDGVTDDDQESNVSSSGEHADNGEVVDGLHTTADGSEVTAPIVTQKTPAKRTPKPKASAALSTKSAKSTPAAAVGGKTTSAKRRRSTQPTSTSAKRKRNSSIGVVEPINSSFELNNDYATPTAKATTARRKINKEALSHIGASSASASRRNVNALALLNRPVVPRPEAQVIDMNARSQTLADRDIEPSNLTFGFLGLGIMGSTIVKDLIYTGHKVVVWNRTKSKCAPFAEAGAEVKDTPFDVVEAADVIFCCVSDPKGSKELVFGNCGVLHHTDLRNKAYVEMSTIDPETSQDIAEGIAQCNGRYLEAQIHGTRQEAEDGMLIIVAGGDRTVFEECHSCFKTIAKNTFFLGEVGNACKVNLILQTIVGVSLVGLAEALALADRFSISLKDILDIFELTSMKSPLLLAKGKEMAKGEFNPQQPLSHMQKDLRLVLNMAENLDQAMPVTATTNEVFKHTKRLGYSDHDSSAVFVRSRF